MVAKDIMTTAVMTVKPNATLLQAIKLLVEIEVSGLIVLDDDNNVVGVISEKDVMVAYDFLQSANGSIKDYYNKSVISVTEDMPIEEVSRVLFERNIHRVPVVRDNKLLGVVSRRDILKYILKKR